MDPYVHVEYNGEQFKTATQKDAGKHPVWDQMFRFSVIIINDEVMIKVYDENSIQKDDLSRHAYDQDFSSLPDQRVPGLSEFTLQFKDKQAGKILLESRFLSNVPVFQDQPISQPFIQSVSSPHQTHRSQFYYKQYTDPTQVASSSMQYNQSTMSTASSFSSQQQPLYTAGQLGVAGAARAGAGFISGTQQQYIPQMQKQQFIPQQQFDPNQLKQNLMGAAAGQQLPNQQQQQQYEYRYT